MRNPGRPIPDPPRSTRVTDFEALRSEFPILERRTYLNSCSLGALSRRSERRMETFLDDWHEMGASAWYDRWLGRVEELRTLVSAFLATTRREIALLPTTSAALSMVAESVTSERNRVVCCELDFPTLAYQWAVKPEVELVVLRSEDGIGVEPARFAEAVDERTLFLATSHVYFTTGYRQDVAELARVARAAGAYSVIDGYQAAGQVELDLPATGVDFYTAGPLKWLCGGPGLSYLYVRAELVEKLEPRITSWFATQRQFDFDLEGFAYRPDARRFELGTPAMPTIHTALGGQELIDEIGMPAIVERNRTLTDRLVERARAAGFVVRAAAPDQRTAIVMIRHADPAGAVRRLAERGIIVDHRPGFVRVSPHFYNTPEEVDRCVDVLAELGG
jgi:selenocysteine lyase/cysteine desulfurase